jgi:hypothetical protein
MKIETFFKIFSSVRIEFKDSANQRIIKVEIKCETMRVFEHYTTNAPRGMRLKIHADLTSTTGAGQFRVYAPTSLSLETYRIL